MKSNFKLFTVEPENDNVVAMNAGSHTHYSDDKVEGTITVCYSVIDPEKFNEQAGFAVGNFVTTREIAAQFKAEIAMDGVPIEAGITSVSVITFGEGSYSVTYFWSQTKEET